jgi:ribosomal-protein-alanine N-acetyltransferase
MARGALQVLVARFGKPELILSSDRLQLRAPKGADFKAYRELRQSNRDYLQNREPTWSQDALSRADFRDKIWASNKMARLDLGRAFFIWDKNFDTMLGGITLGHIRRGASQTASLGYWLGEAYANQGYMSEAVRLVVDYAFTGLALHRVEAACMIDNEASMQVLLNNQFREEGYASRYLKINGKWVDHVLFGLCRDDLAH